MCGIAGVFNYRTGRPVDDDLITSMIGDIRHRGPDWDNVWTDGEFGFGMARLSVVGGDEANQPLFSGAERTAIVFNGMIYNFREINADLGFRTTSDTLTILEGFDKLGTDIFSKLTGMFACAIFDMRQRRLVLARDPFGKKPLFVAETPDGIAFASAVAPLLRVPGIERSLDSDAIADFLAHGYVPSRRTGVVGVRAMDEGTWRSYGAEAGGKRYFTLSQRPESAAIIDEFDAVFDRAVARRLVADVPIGIFLSGGMDSNAVLASALEQQPGSIDRAFTLVTDQSANESETAEISCRHFGIPLEKVSVSPSYVSEHFDRLVSVTDNLLANPPMFALSALSQRARKSVKVVLTGSGGDEVFFGYPTWKADWFYQAWKYMPKAVNAGILRVLAMLPANYAPHTLSYAVQRIVSCPDKDSRRAHAWWRTLLTDKDNLLQLAHDRDWSDSYLDAYQNAEARFTDPIRQTMAADIMMWLQHMGLYMADAVPMGSGIEVRSPFLDAALIDWSISAPLRDLYHPLKTKPFLRRRMRGRLPKEITAGRKRPFHLPLGEWLAGPLSDFMQDTLSRDVLRRHGILDADGVAALMRQHLDRKSDNAFKLLPLMVLTRWRETVYQAA